MVDASPQAPSVSGSNGFRVLIVDDNRDAANSLARLLRLMGLAADVAHSGKEAIAALHVQPADLVFLDIGMAGMDGVETARQIKARFPDWSKPLVAITGLGQEQDRERTREAGFAAHLVKPVRLDVLQETLARFHPLGPGAVG